ncbi:MAG TPA: cytochrome c peroxidase [Candidatus Polarisedimenticolaceae bacterium]|nr:cytochrome c peroxidase [Candidatus Polarisedimenticolaceae bacterium]
MRPKIVLAVLTGLLVGGAAFAALTPQESLGKLLFFDPQLSVNANQSCAACHAPEVGFTGPISASNLDAGIYEGSIPGRFGNRKPPSAAYGAPSPTFHRDAREGLFLGGMFWDGRATGERLGSPLAEQAQGPFLNPLEQALPGPDAVIARACAGAYAGLFLQVCGTEACDVANTSAAYDCVGLAIAAYESSAEVNPFSSKYDAVLIGEATLTKEEQRGLALFKGKGKCANCHPLKSDTPGRSRPIVVDTAPEGPVTLQPKGTDGVVLDPVVFLRPLFTDFSYDNLGIPRNPENPFYNEPEFNPEGASWTDLGLGGFLQSRVDYQAYAYGELGKHKVPTLRNVDKRPDATFVKAYGHNGYFKSLEEIVHFYNTRDVLPTCDEFGTPGVNCWPEPEVALNVNRDELGDLKLSEADERAIVAFLKTLSDGYQP